MAIIKRAANMIKKIEKDYVCISKEYEIICQELFIYATRGDLELHSNKKIIIQSTGESPMVQFSNILEDVELIGVPPSIIASKWLGHEASGDDIEKSTGIDCSYLGCTVFFYFKTRNIQRGLKVTLRLFDREKSRTLLTREYVEGNPCGEGICESGNWLRAKVDFSKYKKTDMPMRLSWRISVQNTTLQDHEFGDWLFVSDQEYTLFVQPSPFDRNMPEIYTKQGEQLCLIVEHMELKDVKNGKPRNVGEEQFIDTTTSMVRTEALTAICGYAENTINSQAHRYALAKLEKGHLMDNHGRVYDRVTNARTLREMKQVSYYSKSGKLINTLQAANFGYVAPDGSMRTTKGVNQYDAFREKKTGCKLQIVGALKTLNSYMNIFECLKSAYEWDPMKSAPPLSVFGPCGQVADLFGILAEMKWSEVNEVLEEIRREQLDKAKMEGLEEVLRFVSKDKYWYNGRPMAEGMVRFDKLEITEETASKIIRGDFRTFEDLENFNKLSKKPYSANITILYREFYSNSGWNSVIEAFYYNK